MATAGEDCSASEDCPNRRAAANTTQAAGDSTGPVGPSPANPNDTAKAFNTADITATCWTACGGAGSATDGATTAPVRAALTVTFGAGTTLTFGAAVRVSDGAAAGSAVRVTDDDVARSLDEVPAAESSSPADAVGLASGLVFFIELEELAAAEC